jgi:hypothetical protein
MAAESSPLALEAFPGAEGAALGDDRIRLSTAAQQATASATM